MMGLVSGPQSRGAEPVATLRLSRAEYQDRVHAVWAGQVIGMLLAYPFEHRVGSVAWVDDFRQPATWEPLAADYARVDAGRAWELNVWVNNQRIDQRLMEGNQSGSKWEQVQIDLSQFAGQDVHLRLYQLVLIPGRRPPGSAYWKDLRLE
jgi:hypothetical protein